MQFSQALFAAVVAADKAKAANCPRWIRAIERAGVALQSGQLSANYSSDESRPDGESAPEGGIGMRA